MPTYTYRCPSGHHSELVQSIHAELPPSIDCAHEDCAPDLLPAGERVQAGRVIDAPVSIFFHGSGFYCTDVKGAQERRRRPNPGDDLHRSHDEAARRIARSL